MRGGPVADRRLDPAALHPTATFVDGWLQARPRDWLAQVGTVAWILGAGTPARWSRRSAMSPWWGDHVHAIRLANAVADQARRRMQQATMGHRGCTYDSLYRIRKLLVTAAEQLTQRGRARLRARDTMKIERGAVRSANLDSTRWPLSWGVASRYRTAGRCGSAAHRRCPCFRTLQVSLLDATDVTGVAPAGRWARHQTHEGVERCHRRCAWSGEGRRRTLLTLPYGRRAPSRRELSAWRITPLARCRWPG
jgi:hypothetical protein